MALRFIQIGVGGFGARWVSEFLPHLISGGRIEPAAIADIDPEVRDRAGELFGLPPAKRYSSAEKAFADNAEADFAIIVVPPGRHEQMVDLAVGAGMHILSEKPIADSMPACARVYHKVRRAGLKMAVTMSHRFDQDKQTLAAEVHSGRHGRLGYVVGRNTWNCRHKGDWGTFRYEIDDPLLIESTVHRFDIIRSVTGADAALVYAETWNPPWSEFKGDSCALITADMTNGVKVFYEGAKTNAAALNSWGYDYFRAECEHATLELDNRVLSRMRSEGQKLPERENIELMQRPRWMNAWLAEMFVDWLEGGPEPPNSLEDNIQAAAFQYAALESAHTGKPVKVQDYLAENLTRAAKEET